jgi:hypothetical protein
LLQLIRNLRTNTVLEWTRDTLNVPGRTVELNLGGTKMVMTDNVENIRAMMSTQVVLDFLTMGISLSDPSSTISGKANSTARFGVV